MKVNELKAEIVRKNMDLTELSHKTGIPTTTFWRRFRGEGNFKLNEIKDISEMLDLSGGQILDIFFEREVS